MEKNDPLQKGKIIKVPFLHRIGFPRTLVPPGNGTEYVYPDFSTVGFIYNLHDQLTDMIDSLGNTHFERDALYRVTAVTDPHGFTVSYNYDEAGNVTKITYPGNKDVIYTYDDLNRLKTVTNWLSQTATYDYDAAGRLTGLTHFNGTQTTYGYDDANRLTFIEHKNVATNSTIARYTYTLLDGNGNRTSIEMLAPLMPTINTVNVPYTYNPKKNRLLQAGATSFTYDDEGQLETMGGVSFGFDFEHRLISAGTSSYAYDGVGTRLRAIHVGIETRYIYDLAGNLLAEANSNNEIIGYYVHGLGLLAMITPQDETFSYHYDGTGNTIAITDQAKQIQNTYGYTPFGVITENEVFDQPFTFSGEYGVIQEPNGFYYMRARYYDPIIGRFISEDPIRFAGGDVNLFAYTGNNPIINTDPSGLATDAPYFGFSPGLIFTPIPDPAPQIHESKKPDNEFVDYLVAKYRLDRCQKTLLHRRISKKGFSEEEIEAEAQQIAITGEGRCPPRQRQL